MKYEDGLHFGLKTALSGTFTTFYCIDWFLVYLDHLAICNLLGLKKLSTPNYDKWGNHRDHRKESIFQQ
jgi:hypothetical protein